MVDASSVQMGSSHRRPLCASDTNGGLLSASEHGQQIGGVRVAEAGPQVGQVLLTGGRLPAQLREEQRPLQGPLQEQHHLSADGENSTAGD